MNEPVAHALQVHPFCRGMRPEHVAMLEPHATLRQLRDGELLTRQGDPTDRCWLVRAGRVCLQLRGAGQARTVETVEEGELLGWSWLFGDHRWHFDAVAQGVVRVIELDGRGLLPRCEQDTAFGFALCRHVLQVAHQRLERSRLHALDLYGESW